MVCKRGMVVVRNALLLCLASVSMESGRCEICGVFGHASGSRNTHVAFQWLGSDNQGATKIEGRFGTDMFYTSLPVRAKVVIAQAVAFRVNNAFEPRFESSPLCRIHLDFENRELHTLPVITADFRDAPQSTTSPSLRGVHIIGNQNHHGNVPSPAISFPEPWRIGIKVAAQMASEELSLKVGDKAERRSFLQEWMLLLLFLALLPGSKERLATFFRE